MENPCKHDKKTTTKTLPLALKIGACRFGIGGVVLFGGVVVVASIVSTLAFKRRSQRRSPSENMNKKKSTSPEPEPEPTPETEAVGGPKKLEVMMKADKDSFAESLPLEVQNPSSVEVASLKEIQTENFRSLTRDESHNYEQSGDHKEDMIFSVVGEDQEKTSIHVDSAFESEEFDSTCEKIGLDSEEQVVMADQIEGDSCLEIDESEGSEEQKHLVLINDETDEHVNANSLVSNEGVILIEEHEAIDVPLKDIVSEASENEDEEDKNHQETVLMNEATIAAAMEAGCVNQIEVKDNLQVQFLEEIENNGHNETGYVDQIGHEVEMEEETTDAAYVNLVRMEDVFKMADHEVEQDTEEMHQVCETFVVACVMNRLKEAVDDQTASKEDAPPKDKERAQKVEEQASIEENLCNEDEKHNVDEMIYDQLIEAAKVDDQTDNPPRQLMTTGHDLINKDEITHVEYVTEDENSEEDVTEKEVIKTADHEVAPEMHKVCETFVAAGLKEAADDQTTEKEDDTDDQTTAKEEAPSKNKETRQEVKEQDNMGEMIHDKVIEAVKVNDQTDNPPRQLMIAEQELVKKEEITHIQSVKDDENSEEDHEVAPELHPVCETFVMACVTNRLKEAVDDQTASKEDAPLNSSMNKEKKDGEAGQKVEEQASIEQEKGNVDEMIHEQLHDAAKVDDETEKELVKKDEIRHVQSVKEDEDGEKLTPEAKISNHKTEENIKGNENLTNLNEKLNASKDEKHVFAAGEPWDLKLMAWSVLISVWCLCHWYSELPFPELSLVGSLLFILVLLSYRNRATYLVKYECK